MTINTDYEKVYDQFKEEYMRVRYFSAAVLSAVVLSTGLSIKLMENSPLFSSSLLDDETISSVKKYHTWNSKFNGDPNLTDFLIEKTFVDKYQVFEIFLNRMFCTVFLKFPKFIGDPQGISKITFEELYSKENLNELRLLVVENKVRQIIQFNSIIQAIKEFEKLLSIKLDLLEEDLKLVYLISRLRNIVTHNRSIFSESVLKELKKENIPVKISVGKSVIPYIIEKQHLFDAALWFVATEISSKISSNLSQMEFHHTSK